MDIVGNVENIRKKKLLSVYCDKKEKKRARPVNGKKRKGKAM